MGPEFSYAAAMSLSTTIQVRVRYNECDPMRVAHHGSYPVWFELARTQLLREQGVAYRDLEEQGVFFVVARMSVRYRRPARYDDELRVTVTAARSAGVKIDHAYEVHRTGGNGERDELLATGQTTLACVDRQGRVRGVPGHLLGEAGV